MSDDSKRGAAPRSTWTEDRRAVQNKWMRDNRYKPSTNIDIETGELFRAWCAAQGRSVSAVLADYIYSIVGRPEDRRAATDPETDTSAATDPTEDDRRTGGQKDGSSGDYSGRPE